VRGAFRFVTRCVEAQSHDLAEMERRARPIARRTFLKHVNREQLREWERRLGYADHASMGLTMAGDYHVTYYKSRFNGRRCVGFDWSRIDHIFGEPTALPPARKRHGHS
jgi:hypothetical protein